MRAVLCSCFLLAVLISGCGGGGGSSTPAPAPTPTTAVPVITPSSGAYTSAQSVTITDSTPGATIYYTTDGATPTTTSSKYSSAIAVSASATVQAFAAASGYNPSEIAKAIYTINLPAASAPTFSPAPGTFSSVQTVTMESST